MGDRVGCVSREFGRIGCRYYRLRSFGCAQDDKIRWTSAAFTGRNLHASAFVAVIVGKRQGRWLSRGVPRQRLTGARVNFLALHSNSFSRFDACRVSGEGVRLLFFFVVKIIWFGPELTHPVIVRVFYAIPVNDHNHKTVIATITPTIMPRFRLW